MRPHALVGEVVDNSTLLLIGLEYGRRHAFCTVNKLYVNVGGSGQECVFMGFIEKPSSVKEYPQYFGAERVIPSFKFFNLGSSQPMTKRDY